MKVAEQLTELRGLTADDLTAKVKELEPWIRTFANELIDAVIDTGHCDFVDAIAEPMPVIIFMKFKFS